MLLMNCFMIKVFEKIKYMYSAAKKAGYIYDILSASKYENIRIEGEILRNVHSIEKGLSLENVRLGFGYAKIKEALSLIEHYIKNGGESDAKPILMFADALHSYLEFHKGKLKNEKIDEISKSYDKLSHNISSHYITMGGYQLMHKNQFSENEFKIVEKLFNNRHSVREFNSTPVDDLMLKEAIKLATRCPSACNRQSYRCYIISKNNFGVIKKWMEGVGGFFEDVDKFIIITGKISVYRKNEELQWVVTPTVFASYLTLSLEALGIGCCFVQRSVIPNDSWCQISEKLNIPGDEQAVCALGIGNLKDIYKVPISYRLPYEDIVTVI